MNTFKNICDHCFKSGNEIFAQIFYRKIDHQWKFLCKKYWNIKKNETNT